MFQLTNKSVIYAVIQILLISVCLPAQGSNAALVSKIEIIGVKELGISDVKKLMDSKFPSWLPFARHPALDEDILKIDMKNIETYYQSNGYFEASASYRIIKLNKKAFVKVSVNITEGPACYVDKVTLTLGRPNNIRVSPLYSQRGAEGEFEVAVTTGTPPSPSLDKRGGNDTDSEESVKPGLSVSGRNNELLAKLSALITLERGKRFSYELYEASKKAMLTYLGDNGYGTAVVTGKALVNKNSRAVETEYIVSNGPLQRFGLTAVTGNKDVKTKDITAELVYLPGDIFSNSKLDQSRENIFNLSLFRDVAVTPSISSGSAFVPVNIEVSEGNKRQIGLGIGYGPETKLRTTLEWDRYYLWGRPRTLTFKASYSAIDGNLTAKIFQPYFIDRKNSLSLTGAFDKEIATSYTIEKLSAQLQVKRNLNNNISIFTAYNAEVDKPVQLSDVMPSDIIGAAIGSSYYISSLSAGLNFAFIDNPAYPAHGVTYSLYVEPASSQLGSQIDYLKGVTECHLYGVLINDLIVASRLKFGVIKPYSFTTDIPIFKRFFSGGSNSVRGFGYQQIGPKDTAGNPIGGEYQFEGNIELHYSIKGNLKGVIFMDTGNIYASSFSLNAYDLNYGVGTGVRYVTPIGPIGIDLAFPVIHLQPIDVSSYYFYLTIGQGF
jgi:outer membrane protein insertion porin family/translocation and assembly module TamA